MAIPFTLPVRDGVMHCYSCTKYHPYRIHGERNPRFDRESGLILSLKDTKERNFSAAVRHFTQELRNTINSLPFRGPAHALIVPSSKANKVSPGLKQVVEDALGKDSRFDFRSAGNLVRTKEIQKLAAGGNRDTAIHLNSISYNEGKNVPAVIFLLDDVTTSGHSLMACNQLIRTELPYVPVIGIVLGKTSYD